MFQILIYLKNDEDGILAVLRDEDGTYYWGYNEFLDEITNKNFDDFKSDIIDFAVPYVEDSTMRDYRKDPVASQKSEVLYEVAVYLQDQP